MRAWRRIRPEPTVSLGDRRRPGNQGLHDFEWVLYYCEAKCRAVRDPAGRMPSRAPPGRVSMTDKSGARKSGGETIELDRDSPIPLYLQIKLYLSRQIAVWAQQNDKFYTHSELCDMFDLSQADAASSILRTFWDRFEMSHAEIHLEATSAGQQEVQWLGVPLGAPLMLRRMRYLTRDGLAVLGGYTLYRADVVRYSIQMP